MSGSRGRPATGALSERPVSKGLPSITGTAPPTRSGAMTPIPGTAGTASRGRTSVSRSMCLPNSALTQKLVLKMRVRFGDAAADIKGQEIISQEVMDYLSCSPGHTIKDEDLLELERRIRGKLCGGTPRSMTLALEKKAQVEGDEWAKMYQYSIYKGQIEDRARLEAARLRQTKMKEELEAQLEGLKLKKKAEEDEERAYFEAEQAALREWEKQEEVRRELQASIMRKLGQEREEQLKEKMDRRQRALQTIKQDEADLAARIAYETKHEFEKEELQQATAKKALVGYLAGNEMNKKLREEAREKEHEVDAKYQKAWEEKLNKQERDRLQLLEKTKVRQKMQADAAAGRPECKRWLDQDVIDRHYREREQARDREEAERIARVKQGSKEAVKTLAEQMKEREELKIKEQQYHQDAARLVFDRVAAEEQREKERLQRMQDAKLKFKAELEAQMKDNAQRRRVAPMTEIERQLNTKLLNQVYDWQTTGKLSVA